LLILGFVVEDELFVALAGGLMLLMGIYYVQVGWVGYPNWFVQSASVILICMGAYLMVVPYLKKWSGW